VNVTPSDYLFYWLFESRDHDPAAPLLIWTNGGPGCSSMEGATTEIGPLSLFDIKEACSSDPNCDYTTQLSTNAYAWNAHANVLVIDQPRTVGFSFGYGTPQSVVLSSVDAAKDFLVFYDGLIDLFPEFRGKPLIIAGESYGGHYIPAFTGAILDRNEQQNEAKINFAGALIGNGCINWTVQTPDAFLEFQRLHNLVPATGPIPAQYNNDSTAWMVDYIGYTPNFYDYRLQSVECEACYGYNYSAWANWLLRPDVKRALNVCGSAGDAAFSGPNGGCVPLPNFDFNDTFDYSRALGRALDAGVAVTLYYGTTDTACNHVGGLRVANSLPWSGSSAFSALPLQSLSMDKLATPVSFGQFKSSGGLTWLQIDDAGHMVPVDQGALGYLALDTILRTLKPSPPSPKSVPESTVWIAVASTFVGTALLAFVVHKFMLRQSLKSDDSAYGQLSEVAVSPYKAIH
jgi:carboxypeptidase C (cathepsin A)